MIIHKSRGTLLAEHQCDLLHGDELTIYPSLDALAHLRAQGVDVEPYWITVVGFDPDLGPSPGQAEFGKYGVVWTIPCGGFDHPDSAMKEYRYTLPIEYEVRWHSALIPSQYLHFCAIARVDMNPRFCSTARGVYRDFGRQPGVKPDPPPRVPVLIHLTWWVKTCDLEAMQ